nr:hypothetical protein [Secundilactobacillus collinoides]
MGNTVYGGTFRLINQFFLSGGIWNLPLSTLRMLKLLKQQFSPTRRPCILKPSRTPC